MVMLLLPTLSLGNLEQSRIIPIHRTSAHSIAGLGTRDIATIDLFNTNTSAGGSDIVQLYANTSGTVSYASLLLNGSGSHIYFLMVTIS